MKLKSKFSHHMLLLLLVALKPSVARLIILLACLPVVGVMAF